MSKKRQLLLMILGFGLCYFYFLLSFLPISVVEENTSYYNVFYLKIAFVALSAALVSSALLFSTMQWQQLRPYFENFKRFQPLLWQLIKRNFIIRYKRSILGVLWSLLNPLLTMLVMTLVFSTLFRFEIPYYPVYIISGQIIFNFFSEAANGAMTSVIGGGSMIKKIYIPKYIFPVSQVMSALVNLIFSFVAFLVVFLITDVPWHKTFFLFPIPLLYLFVFSLGVGMFLSSIAVFFRDIIYIFGIFMTILSFLTPLFYPVSILSERMQQLIAFNPLYHFVTFFRSVTIDGFFPGVWLNIVCASFALFSLTIGVATFQSKQDKYILHL